jgi:hypothetical protein
MKKFTSGFCPTALLAVLMFTACKKDNVDAPSIQGYWIGKYGGLTEYPASFYAFLVRANGTVRVYANISDTANATKGEGTYTFLNGKFNATYQYKGVSTIYNATATATTSFSMLEGTWGSAASYTNGGKFFMGKQ